MMVMVIGCIKYKCKTFIVNIGLVSYEESSFESDSSSFSSYMNGDCMLSQSSRSSSERRLLGRSTTDRIHMG